jgi:hypothetical protein
MGDGPREEVLRRGDWAIAGPDFRRRVRLVQDQAALESLIGEAAVCPDLDAFRAHLHQ